MKNNNNEILLKNLEDKLDAFIQKGFAIGRKLPIEERNGLIKNLINELVDSVVKKLQESEDVNLTKDELIKREKMVKQFAEDFYSKKIKAAAFQNTEHK